MKRRVLVSTYGTAGDLFPLLPIVLGLRAQGHDARCAVPRPLGLYLRAQRLPHCALGDGTEMRILSDPEVVTTRFDGWASWRRAATDYVCPALASDVSLLESFLDDWRPDVIVTTTFAVAARVASFRRGVPTLTLSILWNLICQGLGEVSGRSPMVASGCPAARGQHEACGPSSPPLAVKAVGIT